jgi:hypothetical protein
MQHAFYYTVKLLLAADRTDGSRWAAAVDQASPEADERASWIGRGARSAQLSSRDSSSPIRSAHRVPVSLVYGTIGKTPTTRGSGEEAMYYKRHGDSTVPTPQGRRTGPALYKVP